MKNVGGDWVPGITRFLEDTIRLVISSTYSIDKTDPDEAKFHLWRIAGDEALFYSEKLVSSNQVRYLFTKAYNATTTLDETYKDRFDLGAKSVLWLAGFPKRNRDIIVSSQSPYLRYIPGPFDSIAQLYDGGPFNQTDERIDFLGPEVDLGFRLSEAASPGRVVVSFDAAFHIAMSNNYRHRVKYYHVGWKRLKGLYDEIPYPIFWLTDGSAQQRRVTYEEAISEYAENFFKSEHERQESEVKTFYDEYVRDTKGALIRMYIDDKDMPDADMLKETNAGG